MKRILLALLCVACTGTAWAQSPQPARPLPSANAITVQPATPIQQSTGNRQFAEFMPSNNCAPSCCQPCCVATKTICVPECATKITVKINYSSVCEKICFPKCSCFGGHCNSCCEQGKCDSHIYQKKYLVKHVCTTECPTTKCVAVEVPACDSRGCGIFHRQSGGVSSAPIYVEPIPVPPTKK
jgi:hypothetical protein